MATAALSLLALRCPIAAGAPLPYRCCRCSATDMPLLSLCCRCSLMLSISCRPSLLSTAAHEEPLPCRRHAEYCC
ncbi:hypothetical protein PF010_g31636 [Phytophthora fragariae]|uniref:Secreted protein n=1 Tax=Phytophthora fragariae TaxID=53985 RepID=A0A6A3VHS2_9STRA|nr:hypothetical protein PF003_g27505 [Phytophthora fragariae]KAE8918602.1 hypothetical protein PF009_g31085 [Phytophthora fragariae]KAE9055974.1 hypothetical protein PF007_g32136 [Phytophthora fragariae]KAE9056769.1 hypothetical protein PF010_g31636 [Phytophthora fragariae]KAE9059774.1 hypothetical protein PF006_g31795 [Phytophthora fragariae]